MEKTCVISTSTAKELDVLLGNLITVLKQIAFETMTLFETALLNLSKEDIKSSH